jgi:hypothetical protein
MRTEQSSRTLRLAAALVACGLLLGCKKTEQSQEEATSRADTVKDVSTVVTPPRDPTPAPIGPLAAGDPWEKAKDYLAKLTFVGGPAEHEHVANVCNAICPAKLLIQPERRARDLESDDFRRGQRAIARFELRDNARVPPLGFNAGIRGSQSWLLTTGPTTAVVMYESGGKIAFTPAWQFRTTSKPAEAKQQKAEWRNIPHTHGVDPDTTKTIEHLQSAWVSCAEGCCNATSAQ